MLAVAIVFYLLAGWTIVLADGWNPNDIVGYLIYALGILLWPVITVVLTIEFIEDKQLG